MTSAICWYQSIKNTGLGTWLKGFTEPIWIMTPMNIVSEIAQPVSLAFRHFGNIAGGGVITALIYWALSGASTALLGLISSSHIAVAAVLLVAGILLVLVSRPKAGGKRKKLPFLLGLVCLALSGLRLVDWLWNLTGWSWPEMSGTVCGLCWFAALAVMLAGIVLLIRRKSRGVTVLGGFLTAVGFVAICLISEGPLGVPVLSLGIPAVLSLYFDVFSGVIQAFVFSLLTMIYISGNCPAPEESNH